MLKILYKDAYREIIKIEVSEKLLTPTYRHIIVTFNDGFQVCCMVIRLNEMRVISFPDGSIEILTEKSQMGLLKQSLLGSYKVCFKDYNDNYVQISPEDLEFKEVVFAHDTDGEVEIYDRHKNSRGDGHIIFLGITTS